MTGELIDRETKTPIRIVEFDVAVTTTEAKITKAGIGFMVSVRATLALQTEFSRLQSANFDQKSNLAHRQ